MPTISFSGLASGIDSDAIIQAIIDARRLSSRPLENAVQTQSQENSALQEFRSKLLSFSDSLQSLRTLRGGALSKVASSSDTSAVNVTATNAAPTSSFRVSVQSLAKGGTISFNQTVEKADTALVPDLASDTALKVTVGTGDDAKIYSVPLTASTTLNGLVDSLSRVAPGVLSATAVNTGASGTPSYRVILSALRTGVAQGSLSVEVPPELSAVLGETSSSDAQDAVVTVEGFGQVRRPTNQITDLMPGISLDLKKESPEGTVISVGVNSDATAKSVSDMVAMVNDLLTYSRSNSTIERVEQGSSVSNQYGVLGHTSIDEDAVSDIKNAIARARSGIPGAKIQSFADLGVTTERDGTLKFDSAKFAEAMAKDPGAVQKVLESFGERVGSVDGVISQYTRYQGVLDLREKSNSDKNERANEKLARIEDNLERETQRLKLLYSQLESKMSRLNSDASSLSSLLGSSAVPSK